MALTQMPQVMPSTDSATVGSSENSGIHVVLKKAACSGDRHWQPSQLQHTNQVDNDVDNRESTSPDEGGEDVPGPGRTSQSWGEVLRELV